MSAAPSALIAYRAGVAALTEQGLAKGHLTRRAIVYGAGPACESLLKSLDADPYSDIRVCGVFDDRGVDRASRSIAGYPNLGNLDALMQYCRRARIDMLVVALPVSAETRVLQLIKKLWVLPVDIRLAAEASKLRFRPAPTRLPAPSPSSTSSTGRSRTGASSPSGCSTSP